MQVEYIKKFKCYPRDDRLPHNGRGQDHVTRFLKFCPNYVFRVSVTRHFKCRVLVDTEVY